MIVLTELLPHANMLLQYHICPAFVGPLTTSLPLSVCEYIHRVNGVEIKRMVRGIPPCWRVGGRASPQGLFFLNSSHER